MLKDSLHHLSTEAIIQGCQDESNQFRTQETGYCLELFRRALEEHEHSAWLAIDEQYRRLILHWICDCSPNLPQEEIEQIVPETLPRFWQSLARSTVPLTRRFTHVGAVLKYLKCCAISVLRDHERRLHRVERVRKRLAATDQIIPVQVETEQELLTKIEREQLLQLVRGWVKTHVTDEHERLVLCLSYEYGLTPAEIAARHSHEFPNAQTVRRIKERILKRARRALEHQVPTI